MTAGTARWQSDPQKRLRARGALLRFAFTRTKLQTIRVRSGAGAAATLVPELSFRIQGMRAVAWAPEAVEIAEGSPVTLEISYTGERPELVEVRWLGTRADGSIEVDGGVLPEWLVGTPFDEGGPVPASVPRIEARGEVVTSGADPDDVVEAYLQAGEPMPGDLPAPSGPGSCAALGTALRGAAPREAQREAQLLFEQRRAAIALRGRIECFFLTFDRLTDETLTEGPAVAAGLELLRHRHLARRRSAARGRRESFTVPVPVRDVCGGIAPLFEHCLASAGLEEEHIGLAFELFVSGRLSVVHPAPGRRQELATHGATNSELYFLFAELALACARVVGDEYFTDDVRLRWAHRTGIFVRTTHALATYDWSSRLHSGGAHAPETPLTPYAYFDGLSMSFARIEAFRSAYERAMGSWGVAGDDVDLETLTTTWEDALGQVLGEARRLAPLPWSEAESDPAVAQGGTPFGLTMPSIDAPAGLSPAF